jgi:Ca2+-binding RTX toxin-like protein
VKISIPIRIVTVGLFALIVVSVATAFAAGISTPPTNVDELSIAVTAEDLKPSACNGLSLTGIVSGSGTVTGTSGNDLIIGSSGTDIIDGLGGDDCILGSGGDDSLTGNDGNDVCLGGPGTDIYTNCEVEIQ